MGQDDGVARPGEVADLGLQGEELDDVLRRIARVCAERGKLAGAFGMGAARIAGWVELGYEFVAVDSDATFLRDAAVAALSDARRGLPQDARRG